MSSTIRIVGRKRAIRRHDDALARYERALAANPDHLGANFNLGTVLLALGQKERARIF